MSTQLVQTSGAGSDLQKRIVAGFAEIRELDNELRGIIHAFIREVALPRAREIGKRLLELQALFPKGERGRYGSSSGFYPACEEQAGLSKSSVRRYIKIHENWDWLIGYMIEVPEGARPITSLREAVAVIEGRGRQLPPAVDVTAETVAVLPAPLTATRHVSDTRKKILPPLEKLLATPVGRVYREPFQKALDELRLVLDLMEEAEVQVNLDEELLQRRLEEGDESSSEGSATARAVPASEPQPASTEEPEETPEKAQANRGLLLQRYPLTPEGLSRLEEELLAEGGSGPRLAKKLGVNRSSIARHHKRLIEAVKPA